MKRESMASLLAVLVLLGGAGSGSGGRQAAAATDEQSLAASAEAAAAPVLAALDAALSDVRQPLAAVAGPGREVVGTLQALDIDGMQDIDRDGQCRISGACRCRRGSRSCRDQAVQEST